MRDKIIALSVVASAGLAVIVGLGIGALGGAFDDSTRTVSPPALRSDGLSSAASTTGESTDDGIVLVPPSPTWQVAVPTTPRVTPPETTPDETTSDGTTSDDATPSDTSTTRERGRTRTTTEYPTSSDRSSSADDDSESEDDDTGNGGN